MKLQVTQENLNKALSTVSRVATNRGTLPVLANVLIKTTDNRLSVSATNLDIAITQFVGSKINEEGAITVPARLFQDFVNSLPSGVIDLKLDDFKLKIKAESYASTINGISAEDFPVMPAISQDNTWKLPAKTFKEALQQVVVAASNDDARPVLTGVFLHSHENKLYMVATDSYRLAEKQLGDTSDDTSLLVPANAMQDLLRIVSDSDEDVVVYHDDQQVQFRVGEVELVTRLIDGNYPDYRKLIPAKFANTARLERQELANIAKVASLFARESAGSIVASVDEKDSKLHVRSVASQLGDNTSSATAKVTGEDSITLNSRYLMDSLSVLHGKEVEFCFNGKLEPVLIRDPANPDYLHVIMPLKS
jgi:DNA polymerase-3 subunit beta